MKNCITFSFLHCKMIFYFSANTKLIQSTFTAWKQYMTYRNMKKNFGNAYHIADTRRLSQAWQRWRDQIQRRQDRDSMQQHALQYWADALIHKVGYKTKVATFDRYGSFYTLTSRFHLSSFLLCISHLLVFTNVMHSQKTENK